MDDIKVKTWKPIFTVPEYLIQGMGDAGTYETYNSETGEFIESDDLRVTIEISGGHKILVPCGARIILGDTGDMTIEMLMVD